MYILALIHTFPFIVVDFKYGTMHSRWHGSYEYWSGVAALVPNTFLVTMSIGVIRNKYYETFKRCLLFTILRLCRSEQLTFLLLQPPHSVR